MTRVFTLEEARALLPKVRLLTAPAFELAASFAEELREAELDGREDLAESLRERLQGLIESWTRAIQDLGLEAKGLWLVDFDSGDGYWCWVHPEAELSHWHSYEGGFGSRVPLELRPTREQVKADG
jgi:hypothetical protein